jgi:poly-gamma-glutamate synthesis protein (capsule biosynthesis protein)
MRSLVQIIFFAIAFWASGCSTKEGKGIFDQEYSTAEDKTVKLIFVGDIMQHSVQIRSAYDPKSGRFDYEPCFRYVSPLFEKVDFVIGNLELTLNDKNNYSGYPTFKAPDILAEYLQKAGFDVLITANNHINDNGKYGLMHTLDVLDSFNLKHTGAFRNEAERAAKYPLILEKKVEGISFRLALLSYTYGTNGMTTYEPNIVNLIDTVQIKLDLLKASKLNSDFTIVCLHWGQEYQHTQNKEQEKLTQWLWENGADLVVGSHPHVIQPIVIDTVAVGRNSSKKVACAYSLGNFISNQFNPPGSNIGLMYEVELTKNARTGKKQISKHHYIPVFCYIHNQKKSVNNWVYSVIPISAFETDSTNFLGMSKSKRNEMLKDYERTQKLLRKYAASEMKISYSDIVKNGILPPDSVVTNLIPLQNPIAPNIRRYSAKKKSKKSKK